MCFGSSKNHLIEMVLLRTHNIKIMLWLRNKKNSFQLCTLYLDPISQFLPTPHNNHKEERAFSIDDDWSHTNTVLCNSLFDLINQTVHSWSHLVKYVFLNPLIGL